MSWPFSRPFAAESWAVTPDESRPMSTACRVPVVRSYLFYDRNWHAVLSRGSLDDVGVAHGDWWILGTKQKNISWFLGTEHLEIIEFWEKVV